MVISNCRFSSEGPASSYLVASLLGASSVHFPSRTTSSARPQWWRQLPLCPFRWGGDSGRIWAYGARYDLWDSDSCVSREQRSWIQMHLSLFSASPSFFLAIHSCAYTWSTGDPAHIFLFPCLRRNRCSIWLVLHFLSVLVWLTCYQRKDRNWQHPIRL